MSTGSSRQIPAPPARPCAVPDAPDAIHRHREPVLDTAAGISLPRALKRSAAVLVGRLTALEARLLAGDEEVLPTYLEMVKTSAAVAAALGVGQQPRSLLTTTQYATILNVTPKTILRRMRRGELRPAVAKGKFIRWRDDVPAPVTTPLTPSP